jgi:peptidoglycan hydrolase CwlO-like protein
MSQFTANRARRLSRLFFEGGAGMVHAPGHMLYVFTSEASMADFDSKIRESQDQVATAQAKISAITSRIEVARVKLAAGEAAIDVENASLEDVHKHTDLMNANIADLIMGLDDVTAGFSRDFDEMRNKTGMESVIGFFSSARADSMRQERMRTASIDDKLQDLIGKSDIIVKLLQGQLDLLNTQKASVEENLTSTLNEREATVGSLEALRAEISTMDPAIIELENKISVEQDAAKRTKLESELAALNTRYNALVQQEQVDLAKSQTLERYIEKGKTWMDSLQNQAATQMVLINKLQTDTKQRVVLYDALSSSLKTAQQQDVAHRINEIGVKTDQEAQAAMAAIGTATNQRMADMMEAHEDHMVFARKILEQKAKADERFARRFAAIVEKHDKNQYGG